MNERIRELLIEAREVTKEGDWKPPTHVWADKFAELIIKECIDILNPEGDLTSMREEYGRKLSMNMIKEHFGIE